jgi:DNA-binding NarL/FixJ family response regulator
MSGVAAAVLPQQRGARGGRATAPAATTQRYDIAIVERLPAYRRGLAVGFAARHFHVQELRCAATIEHVDAFAVTIDQTLDWELVGRLKEMHPDSVVVVLLDDFTVRAWRQALRAGADGVVPREAPIEEIVSVVEAALAGITALPTQMARELVRPSGGQDSQLEVTASEIVWLRELAVGTTIATLARSARYSERQMHRLVADLYKRIGASNRQEALVLAARYGILDD